MRHDKPTREEIEKFNGEYDKVIALKSEMDEKFRKLIKQSEKVDKAADKLFKSACSNGNLGMFYCDDNGKKMKCASKSVLNRIDTLNILKDYSLGINY